MKRLRVFLVGWLLLLMLAGCGETATNSTPTVSPPLATSSPTVLSRTVSPTTAPSIGRPASTNTLNPTTSPRPSGTVTPVVARPDLTEHEVPMLPAFKGDVKLNQAAGAPIYNISLRILPNPDKPEASGHEQVIYTNDTGGPLDSVYLWLWANEVPLPQGVLPVLVSNLRVNGQIASWTLENNGSMVRVSFEAAHILAPGASATIDLDFSLKISTDPDSAFFRYTTPEQILHLCYWYPQVAVYDKSIGGWDTHSYSPAGDVTNSRISFFKVWLTAPTEQVIVANGKLVEVKANPDSTKTSKFVTGPVRDFAAALSPLYQSATQQSGDTKVTSYFLEKDRLYGEKMLQYAVDALKTYNEAFGIYPYQEFNVVETVLTSWGGLEFPGLIYITNRYFAPDFAQSLEYVVAHETGHQWWYGLVGSDQIRHPFQDEGLTQYVPVLYFERFKGKTEAQKILQTYMRSGFVAAVNARRDDIVDQPVATWSQSGDYVLMVYNKAGLFYDVYRQKFGDAAFLKFARTYLQNNRYKFVTPDAILEALKTGVDPSQASAVTELYRHWITAKEGQQDVK